MQNEEIKLTMKNLLIIKKCKSKYLMELSRQSSKSFKHGCSKASYGTLAECLKVILSLISSFSIMVNKMSFTSIKYQLVSEGVFKNTGIGFYVLGTSKIHYQIFIVAGYS